MNKCSLELMFMPLAVAYSGALQGVHAQTVVVEVNSGEIGEPRHTIVGLPDAAVKESQNRVLSALMNSDMRAPMTRMTINLAPGHLRKEGPLYDLPIALAILAAIGQMSDQAQARMQRFQIAGELSLSGETRAVKGGLALALLAKAEGRKGILLPQASAEEAALVEGIEVYAVNSLAEAREFLEGYLELAPMESPFANGKLREALPEREPVDFAEVKGQHALRRAVEVAVAGGHNLLIIGPPGSGKSMIAKRIPTIMPEPSLAEYLEILSIYSAAGKSIGPEKPTFRRPFRSPHHTISDVGLLGGGSIPGPGEISLAHQGVLFLDELPEFRRSTLEVLRQPLEDGKVTISRSAGKITLPAAFMLVAAMNPSPGGYSEKDGRGTASPVQIQRYRARISGPLLDRIDLHVEAPAVGFEHLRDERPGESSATIRERIRACRAIQSARFNGLSFACNARMGRREIERYCALQPAHADMLEQAMINLKLSARAYDRVLKVARTIADLAQSEAIVPDHLMEAIQYRNLDRELFF